MKYLITLISITSLISCSQKLSSDWIGENYTDGAFNKIAVVGVGDNLKSRTEFEQTATKLFRKRGINAVEGISIFPFDMSEEEQKTENMVKIITENKIDAVLTMTLIDTEEAIHEEGQKNPDAAEYYQYMRFAFGASNDLQTLDDYSSSKSYVIEAVLYDLRGDLTKGKNPLVWSGQSSIVDPSSLESIARSFSKKLVSHTIDEKIITK